MALSAPQAKYFVCWLTRSLPPDSLGKFTASLQDAQVYLTPHQIDAEQGGISKSQNWKGGGGFKFYELAPSLLNHDKYGNLVINKEYNADMLAAAMAKHQGFTYSPDAELYWKQGHSSEHDFIFTTTQLLTIEMLESIHEQLDENESLLICCSKFQPGCRDKYANITIKKIPKVLLDTCEFDRDDYSLKSFQCLMA